VQRFLERHAPVLFVAVLAVAAVVPTFLPGTAEADSDRLDHLHPERPVAAPGPTAPVRLDRAGLEARLGDAYARLAFLRSLPGDPGPAPSPSPARPVSSTGATADSGAGPGVSPTAGACQGEVDCFLACTRAHESDGAGGYAAVGGGGAYRGAYQFSQRTWDAAVAGAGWAEYVGTPADAAPPEIQDAAAAHLYSVSGSAPWGGRC